MCVKLLVRLMERIPTGAKAVTFQHYPAGQRETVALFCFVWDSAALRAANNQSEHKVSPGTD